MTYCLKVQVDAGMPGLLVALDSTGVADAIGYLIGACTRDRTIVHTHIWCL